MLRWQLNMQKEIGSNVTHEDIKEFLWRTLKSGQVVPGYVSDVYRAFDMLDSRLVGIATVTVC